MNREALPKHLKSVMWVILGMFLMVAGCREKVELIPDNDAPWYGEVPTVTVNNYVNRIYIDLIGREPLNVELAADVEFLRSRDLEPSARMELMERLQLDTTWRDGDSSYKFAHFHHFYELSKVRHLEGASEAIIQQKIGIVKNSIFVDSLTGDSVGMELGKARMLNYQNIIDAEHDYREGSIDLAEFNRRMVNNGIYDEINMNSFNFVNAAFNDLYFRFPSNAEFDAAFDMVEFNFSSLLFQQSGATKDDFAQIMVNTNEFWEGMIRFGYLTLLAREPSTGEVASLLPNLIADKDFQKVLRIIMAGKDYAGF